MLNKGAKTRLKLLDVAVKLIGKHGFDDLTYEAVATQAGVSWQLVQKYFPDRRSWLLVAFEHATVGLVEIVNRALETPALADDRLRRYLNAHLEWVLSEPHGARALTAFLGTCASQAELKKANSVYAQAGRKKIENLIVEIGLLRQNRKIVKRAETLSFRVQALLTGVVVCILSDSTVSIEQAKCTVQEDLLDLGL